MTTADRRVRVLYCESNMDGTIGGSHYCLLYLLEELDKTRFEPTVVFFESHPLISRFEQSAETVVIVRDEPHVFAALRSPFAKTYPLLVLPLRLVQRAVNFFGFVRLVRQYCAFLKDRQIDIVHLNNSIIRHHDWMLAARLTGRPCISHERGINRWYSAATKWWSRRLAAVVPMSKSIRDYMLAGGVDGHNMLVLYDGIDPNNMRITRTPDEVRQVYGLKPGQPVIGIVGNVRHWKGQEVVVRAVGILARKYPDLVCLIVGAVARNDEAYEAGLRKLCAELGIEKNVVFAGYQKHPSELVSVMDAVVHASVEPEPFGMVVLEAMGMRKPMVGSRAGGVPEMVIHGVTGFTYTPGDHAALAGHLDELLADPARAKAMGEAGYARLVSDFTVQKYADQVEALYRDVLDGKPPRDVAAAS
jgi:glycosyltransferase involved in cell wall biosynthesis